MSAIPDHTSSLPPPSSNPSSAPPSPAHQPVLQAEVRAILPLRPGDLAVDVTVGAGGHAADMLTAVSPSGRLIGLDADPSAIATARALLTKVSIQHNVRFQLIKTSFRFIGGVLAEHAPENPPRAILADLGVSSMQFDQPQRGFSFRFDAPLDMRMDPDLPRTAADLLNDLPEEELADIFFHMGGERHARAVARRVVQRREAGQPVLTTTDFAQLVCSALHVRGHQRIHPATRCFMALRLAVNDELGALRDFLAAAPPLLAPGGVLAVIAFHSGEDRIVKQAFKEWASTGRFIIVGKHVLRPGADECCANPRARSARLRALRREG